VSDTLTKGTIPYVPLFGPRTVIHS